MQTFPNADAARAGSSLSCRLWPIEAYGVTGRIGVNDFRCPGEPLFAFVRASDQAPMSCKLRFHGESYGWEAQFYERGEPLIGRRFGTRAMAVQWAEQERKAAEQTRGRA